MTCKNCNSDRLIQVYGKSSDLNVVNIGDKEHEGYLPEDLGIGGGDDIQFTYCGDCGMIQGTFPLQKTQIEAGESDGDDSNGYAYK